MTEVLIEDIGYDSIREGEAGVITCIEDQSVIDKILMHLRARDELPSPPEQVARWFVVRWTAQGSEEAKRYRFSRKTQDIK